MRRDDEVWVSHSEDIPIRDQIVTQVALGIASGELSGGTRLPSTRDLARRLQIHPNTVSAAYRQLERDGRVHSRHGSGVYIQAGRPPAGSQLDTLIASFLERTIALAIPKHEILDRLRKWLDVQSPDHFLLVEPDPELRAILMAELRQAVTLPVCESSPEAITPDAVRGSTVLVLPSRADALRTALGPQPEMHVLQVTSVPGQLSHWLPAPGGRLVGICSRWPEFLRLARTMLIGAGMEPEALLTRDARDMDWQRGLDQTAAVVCDVLVAAQLPHGPKVIPFHILADSSIADLRAREASMLDRTSLEC